MEENVITWGEPPPSRREGKYAKLLQIYRDNPGKWGRWNDRNWELSDAGAGSFASNLKGGGLVGTKRNEFDARVSIEDGYKWVWIKYNGV